MGELPGTGTHVLDLAEAVADGRLALPDAEATLRRSGGSEGDAAELRELVRAVQAVRGHAAATSAHSPVAGATPAGPAPGRERPAAARPGGVVAGPFLSGRRGPSPGFGATPALLAVAAVVVVALIGTLALQATSGPRPGGTRSVATLPTVDRSTGTPAASAPAVLPSEVPVVSPGPVSAASIPPIVSRPLPGAPVAAIWAVSAIDAITVYAWDPGDVAGVSGTLRRLAVLDVWPEQPGSGPNAVQRRMLVSPDGQRIALLEWMPIMSSLPRLRVFSIAGQLLWQPDGGRVSSNLGPPYDLAWSADGTVLAVGTAPWTVVRFDGDRAIPSALDATWSSEAGYQLLGFSADGAHVYGYDPTAEVDFWQRPMWVDLATGAVTRLDGFGSGGAAFAGGSTTAYTAAGRVRASDGAVLGQPGEMKGDPTWQVIASSGRTPLGLPTADAAPDPRWGPDGKLVVAGLPDPGVTPRSEAPDSIQLLTAGPDPAPVAPAFVLPKGTYAARLLTVRDGYALALFAGSLPADPVVAEPGYDEAVLIRLSDAASTVLASPVPDGLSAFRLEGHMGIHFGGWMP